MLPIQSQLRPTSDVHIVEALEPKESRFYCADRRRTYVFADPYLDEKNATTRANVFHTRLNDAVRRGTTLF